MVELTFGRARVNINRLGKPTLAVTGRHSYRGDTQLQDTSSLQDTHEVLKSLDECSVCARRLGNIAFQDGLRFALEASALVSTRDGIHVTPLSAGLGFESYPLFDDEFLSCFFILEDMLFSRQQKEHECQASSKSTAPMASVSCSSSLAL